MIERTFNEFAGRVKNLSLHLIAAGVKKGECITVISEIRPVWPVANLAVLFSGCTAISLDAQLLYISPVIPVSF